MRETTPQTIIRLKGAVCRKPEWSMAEPADFELCEGEHIAIVGENGAGKSMLVDMITGRHPLLGHDPFYDFRPSTSKLASENIAYITFRDCYGADNDRTYFLQQRWNQFEIDPGTPTVGALLEEAAAFSGIAGEVWFDHYRNSLFEIFQIGSLLDKYIILLSSGELRKFQLVKVLLKHPRVLIIDNPFIGLDSPTRAQLCELFEVLASKRYVQMVLVLSRKSDIPPVVTHVVEVSNRRVMPKLPVAEYLHNSGNGQAHVVVGMNHITVRYGARTILKDFSWTVCRGERWALTGENGSGKSTLLSLICADNPQAYACDITLFDHPRGSGESIWDIKRHIGYVSPEMHRAYQRNIPCEKIVASGLKETIGLYERPTEADYQKCRRWMQIFGIEELWGRSFLELSSGEQRLVLLARAFVKDPQLLILDEPLHGLDDRRRQMVRMIIDGFCQNPEKTLLMVSHYEDEFPQCITNRLHLQKTT